MGNIVFRFQEDDQQKNWEPALTEMILSWPELIVKVMGAHLVGLKFEVSSEQSDKSRMWAVKCEMPIL